MVIGQNVDTQVKDGKLIVTIDLGAQGTRSSSGKSVVIASSRGNAFISEAGVTLGINVYRKA